MHIYLPFKLATAGRHSNLGPLLTHALAQPPRSLRPSPHWQPLEEGHDSNEGNIWETHTNMRKKYLKYKRENTHRHRTRQKKAGNLHLAVQSNRPIKHNKPQRYQTTYCRYGVSHKQAEAGRLHARAGAHVLLHNEVSPPIQKGAALAHTQN